MKRKSRLKNIQKRSLLEHFVAGTTARSAAEIININRHTATKYYHKIRQLIAEHVENEKPFEGEIEIDESYFGGRRKGKRGRGAAGKIPVFGILKRKGKVYTKVVADTKSNTLIPIIHEKVLPDSIVYTDTYRSYNALDISSFHHLRINHSKIFADKK